MFGKTKSFASPSDAQASEKLALYVYEYLVYSGAQKAAQTFLQEIGWEKHIVPNEAPGFLFSWWSVFWDLYCAAPERRDALKHSPDARAFYDYGLANSGFVPSNPQPSQIGGPGLHYIQGRNGPPAMLQHQQYMSQPRQMYPPGGISRPNDIKMPGLVPMGEQHLEAFLSSPPAAAAFRPNSNIPSLPIASAPTVTLRHQPRPPMGTRGPLVANGNAVGGPLNSSSSTASSSFSGSSPNGDFQAGMHQQQFGRPHPFQQQRSLPLKMSPCTPNGMLSSQQQQQQQQQQPPQWGPGLNQPLDFLGNPQATPKLSPDVSTAVSSMLFDPTLMESQPQQQQQPPLPSSSSGAVSASSEGFAFFDQADGLPGVDEAVATMGQAHQQQPPPVSSQISQLLSPSPIQQTSRQDVPRAKAPAGAASIEEALLLTAPELDLLTSADDASGVVEAVDQAMNGPPTQAQPHVPPPPFDGEQLKASAEAQNILFSSSEDLRTVQNLVDAMQDPTSGDLLPPAPAVSKPFCPLKDIEASAALFLQE